jgi:hypothetical protein
MQKIIEALQLYLDAQENSLAVLRNALKTLENPKTNTPISEDQFNRLNWRDEIGKKLLSYQIALPQDQSDKNEWQELYDFLFNQGSRIDSRFHREGYHFSYWIYPEKYHYKIFRQQLKEGSQ